MMVFAIGFISVAGSLSVYATSKLVKSRVSSSSKQSKPTPQKPLVLPWLITSNEPLNRNLRTGTHQRPVIITIQARNNHRQAFRKESLPPYLSEPLPLQPVYQTLAKQKRFEFSPPIPLTKLQPLQTSVGLMNSDQKKLARASAPASLFESFVEPHCDEIEGMDSFETSDQSMSSDENSNQLSFRSPIQWSTQDQRSTNFRDSISSITSSNLSHARDSFISCHEFEWVFWFLMSYLSFDLNFSPLRINKPQLNECIKPLTVSSFQRTWRRHRVWFASCYDPISRATWISFKGFEQPPLFSKYLSCIWKHDSDNLIYRCIYIQINTWLKL